MRAYSLVAVMLAVGSLVLSTCSEARAAEQESELYSLPLLVSGVAITVGGIGGGVALAATAGPCGAVDDQCAIAAMLLGPSIAGIFIGVPMMIVGAQPAEDDEPEDARLPEVVTAPGGAGLLWRF